MTQQQTIQLIADAVIVWARGIPVAIIALGLITRYLPPAAAFTVRRGSYVLLCMAWPVTVARMVVMAFAEWRRRR